MPAARLQQGRRHMHGALLVAIELAPTDPTAPVPHAHASPSLSLSRSLFLFSLTRITPHPSPRILSAFPLSAFHATHAENAKWRSASCAMQHSMGWRSVCTQIHMVSRERERRGKRKACMQTTHCANPAPADRRTTHRIYVVLKVTFSAAPNITPHGS